MLEQDIRNEFFPKRLNELTVKRFALKRSTVLEHFMLPEVMAAFDNLVPVFAKMSQHHLADATDKRRVSQSIIDNVLHKATQGLGAAIRAVVDKILLGVDEGVSQSMKSHDIGRRLAIKQLPEPMLHLFCRLFVEGEQHYFAGFDAAVLLQEVGTVNQRGCFSTACAGNHLDVAMYGCDSLRLLVVQGAALTILVWRGVFSHPRFYEGSFFSFIIS